MEKYILDFDEVVLLDSEENTDEVLVYKDDETKSLKSSRVFLTNKKLVIEYRNGFLKRKFSFEEYELKELKIRRRISLIKLPSSGIGFRDETPALDISFLNIRIGLIFGCYDSFDKRYFNYLSLWADTLINTFLSLIYESNQNTTEIDI